MNNNQNNFNQNNEISSNTENSNYIPNNKNTEQPLNVIPQISPVNNNQSTDVHEFDNAFIKSTPNNNTEVTQNQSAFVNNQVIPNQQEEPDEINNIINHQQNRFINDNIDTTNNHLNNLNIVTEHGNAPKVDYSQDPKVQENLKKRNTITITSEGKIFIIIIIVLLLFIFILPTVFEYIRNIQYQ